MNKSVVRFLPSLLVVLLLALPACDEEELPGADASPDAGPVVDGAPDAPADAPADLQSSDAPDAGVPDLPPPDAAPDQLVPDLLVPDSRPTAYQTVLALTGPTYTGRKGGTAGGTAAAKYIAARLAACGLTAFGDSATSFLQTFKVTPIVHTGKMEMTLLPTTGPNTTFTYRKQWRTGRLSPASNLTADLVFIGYGLDHAKHNDYKGVTVTGKVLLALRGCPPAIPPNDPGCGDISKIDVAAKMKAAALVLVADDDGQVDIWGGNQGHVLYKVPAALIKPGPAAKLLPAGKTYATLRTALDKSGPQTFSIAGKLRLIMTRKVFKNVDAYNVLGILKSADPKATEYVLAGAHYDHLGFDEPPKSYFPGALDNASGTSVVVEAACLAAARAKAPPKRHLVFALWGAEEDGLIGSGVFVKSGKISMKAVNLAINLDMVGGTGPDSVKVDFDALHISKTRQPVIKKLAATLGLKVSFGVIAHGRSDHAHFVNNKVETVYFYGPHPAAMQYHTLADLPTQLSPTSLDSLSKLVDQLMWAAASPAPPSPDAGPPDAAMGDAGAADAGPPAPAPEVPWIDPRRPEIY